jgi:glycerate dehydrogenase
MSNPPRLVILDAHTTNPGDLDWSPLRALADCLVHPRTAPAQVVERARGAEFLLTNKTPLREEHLEALPGLRYIGVLATGVNVVDLEACRRRGIAVTNVAGYSTESTAQHVFALLLALLHRVEAHDTSVREGEWARCPDFCYWRTPLVELAGLTLGLVGYGRIARRVAAIGRAFGMRLAAYTPRPPADAPEVIFLALDDLLTRADVISLHCPLTPETSRLINAERLALLKPSAVLLNAGRGGLIDEPALAAALRAGRLAGAGLDVLNEEPPVSGSPLIGAPNCLITPHIAWATRASRARLISEATVNLLAFLRGERRNRVD